MKIAVIQIETRCRAMRARDVFGAGVESLRLYAIRTKCARRFASGLPVPSNLVQEKAAAEIASISSAATARPPRTILLTAARSIDRPSISVNRRAISAWPAPESASAFATH